MTATTPGEPCWIELSTTDTDAAAAFYCDLLGWTAGEASPEFGGYRMFFHGETPVAGLMAVDDGSGTPSSWSVYLASDDAAATVERARAAGGTVLVEPMPIADLGTMAVLADTAGAVVGVWQADTFAGFGVRAQVGAPGWFETLSTDYPASVAFYTDVFDWDAVTVSDTSDFRYTTLGRDADARAGIMDATGFLGEQPSRWQFYVQVADTDATVERAVAAGATAVLPVDDSPYGRLALMRDPTGVQFCLMGPTAGG